MNNDKPIIAVLAGLTLAATGSTALAAPTQIRVVWDHDPAHEAIVAFSEGSGGSPYLLWGDSTDENSWENTAYQKNYTFDGSLRSYFVRLTNLQPGSNYYFRACDSKGCGERFWFTTASDNAADLTFIAGGDSRSNPTARRQGNRLVSKVRPQFVLFGGDLTDDNRASEVDEWLDNWTETYSNDVIDGVDYKRVYPLVPTVGNHEDNDQTFICKVFGVDANKDGSCSLDDTYFAFTIGGGQARFYTLNTEFRNSGYEAEWREQMDWLKADLASDGSSVTWRMTQYHKPMFPRTTSKPSKYDKMYEWAQPFYAYKMNLSFESDSHLVKYTWPVVPDNDGYAQASAGTLYVGEGSWGAPTRSADRYANWIIDQDSFAQLKIVQFSGDEVLVRTARFSGEGDVTALSKAQRDADPLALPSGLNLWKPQSVGEIMTLTRSGDGLTQVKGGGDDPGPGDPGDGDSTTLAAMQDVTVGSNGFHNNGDEVYADGSDGGQELRALLSWDLSAIPADSSVDSVELALQVVNSSGGEYGVYAGSASWSENGADWNDASTGVKVGSVTPSSKGSVSIGLNEEGRRLVEGWINGQEANKGLIIASMGTSDGVDFVSREGGQAAKLIVAHQAGDDSSGRGAKSFSSDQDVSVGSQGRRRNSSRLEADGSDGGQELRVLMHWNLSDLPAQAKITSVKAEFSIVDPSSGSYSLYSAKGDWSESAAQWSDAETSGGKVATFTPSNNGSLSVNLGAAGIELVQSWLSGAPNNGLVLSSDGTSNGVDIESRESSRAPKLIVEYEL
ncbi:DNRLRE domain-containing protein [Hahella sp. CR1]|uniref:DNRLRE domain-containing protein n=1 Tax=Hahella sp. CR1 TaxID=2992807 RepID=UPI002442553B|nr:DNRLRE domain-containing protein [Hahella sp. CR1]MDG9670503.1 DNRLRE domain-containing protein [Hahella sp. CR1]